MTETQSTKTAPAIEVRDLHKSFGDNQVLKGIDFQVESGEVVCVIGPSGSGKSTLLRCVNLLEEPTSGTIHVGGTEVTLRIRQELLGIQTGAVEDRHGWLRPLV